MRQEHLTALAWGLTLTGISIIVSTLKIANEASRTEITSGANASVLMSIVHRLSPKLEEMKKEPAEEPQDLGGMLDEPYPPENSGKEALLKK